MSKYTNSKSRPHQNVRDTSRAAYTDVKRSTKTASQTAATLRYIQDNGPASRRMIATATQIPLTNMTRIIFDLCKAGSLTELATKRPCVLSKVNVYYLAVNE